MQTTDLLKTIDSPHDLRKLNREQLPALASELRSFVVDSVSKTGGHLSSNLGTVELTIALHYVLNTPDDRLIWDVGHQSYAHKILTGRRDQMSTLRKFGGISGFPRRSESQYDTFGTAHSSTSISAALGMARASQTKGEKRVAVAVIGDGSMSAGMAFEALNNAGIYHDLPLLVILNDNDMSISPAVGALNRYLARLMSGNFYAKTKKGLDSVLSMAPPLREFAKRLEEHVKGMVVPGTIFEELGFNYIGPIDGHDLDSLVPTLQNVKRLALEGGGPQFLHVVTKKGQGYKLAEADPILYHGPGQFDPTKGITASTASKKTFTQVFGEWLCDMAEKDERLVGITPAMREGSGMVEFERRFPDRYYDVGIAEQHAVTFAAGMACEAMKPVVAIYSTFLQRGYDQLIHDVALQNLPVIFCLDRAGLVGEDGATHHGVFDIAYLNCIPNMIIAAPKDEIELRNIMFTASEGLNHPIAIRYPRGRGENVNWQQPFEKIQIGKIKELKKGIKVAVLSTGTIGNNVTKALNEVVNPSFFSHFHFPFIKPLDLEAVKSIINEHDHIVTIEDGVIRGGFGEQISAIIATNNLNKSIIHLGVPDSFIEHGTVFELQQLCKIDVINLIQLLNTF